MRKGTGCRCKSQTVQNSQNSHTLRSIAASPESIISSEDLLPIIREAVESKKTSIWVDNKGTYYIVHLFQGAEDGGVYNAAWNFYVFTKERRLEFDFLSDTAFEPDHPIGLADRLEQEGRLLSLTYWWIALQPIFQKGLSGWTITADGINSVTAKVLLLHGPFKDIKVVRTDGYYFKAKDPDHPNEVMNLDTDGKVIFLPRNLDIMQPLTPDKIPDDNGRYDLRAVLPKIRSNRALSSTKVKKITGFSNMLAAFKSL